MGNYRCKIDLLKCRNSAIIPIKGREEKMCVVIPIEDNHLSVTQDADGKAKSAYLDYIAWETKTPLRSGDTHGLKQSFPRDFLGEEERYSLPFIGYMRPMKPYIQAQEQSSLEKQETSYFDDMPF